MNKETGDMAKALKVESKMTSYGGVTKKTNYLPRKGKTGGKSGTDKRANAGVGVVGVAKNASPSVFRVSPATPWKVTKGTPFYPRKSRA